MFSASEVIPGLWVGAKSDVECEKGNFLIKWNITHVLSVDTEPLTLPLPNIKKKFVQLDDREYADLLVHLEECFAFIEEGMKSESGAVIVHCLVGMSRSVSVVTAYLMYKEQISLNQALDKVRKKRPYVRPNQGFLEQLSLFEAMGCNLNPHHPLMKFHKLGQFAQEMQDTRRGRSSEIPKDLIEKDPNERTGEKEDQMGSSMFRCRKCRRALFRGSSVIGHDPGKGQLSFKWHKQGQSSTPLGNPADVCTSYFIQPVTWMEEFLDGNMESKLSCPKCSSRLGCFNWAGQQCSCGAWITPAFQIHKNRVDEKRVPVLPK